MQPLLGTPRENLDPALVAAALSLTAGARVRHGVEVLSPAGEVTGSVPLTGGSVTWSYRAPDRVIGQTDSVAAVRRQASLSTDATSPGGLLRVWTEWMLPDRTWARFYLGVFVVTNPGALADDGTRRSRTLDCADKSYLWATASLTEPLHIAAGTRPVTYVAGRLQALYGESALALTGADSPLAADRTFEAGTSLLEVWSSLLEADGGEQLTADELGRPASQPKSVLASRGAEVTYGAGQGKVLTAGSVEPLLPWLPNVLRFSARQGPSLGNVEGNGLRTVRNQSTGPASIQARGYEVELRVDVDADDQATLDAVATADAQRYFAGGGLRWSGRVGLNPRHSDRDVIAVSLPRLGLSGGVWQVTEWTYPLGGLDEEGSVLMPVTAERRVEL